MPCRIVRGLLVAALAIPLLASPAWADGADGHATAVARFEQGTKLVQQGDCAGAIPLFVESLKNEEGVGAHLNLADCYARTGATARAWTEFKAAERFATLKRNDERREVAHNGAYALESKVLRLTLTIPYVDGLEVQVNGTTIDRELIASRQIALEPGPYKLDASASHKKPVTKTGSGAAGEVQSVAITFEDDPTVIVRAPAQPGPALVAPPSSTQKTAGIIVGVVGLAVLAAGSVFGVVAIDDKATLKSAFERNPNCSGGYPGGTCHGAARAELDARETSAFRSATISTVFFVAGGVVLAAGATLFFTAPSQRTSATKPGPLLAVRALLLGATW